MIVQPIAFLLAVAMVIIATVQTEPQENAFRAKVRAEPQVAEIAQPIQVTLTATAPPGWTIRLPEVPPNFGHLQVVRSEDNLMLGDGGAVTATRRLSLEAFAPGRHRIAPFGVRFDPARVGVGAANNKKRGSIERETREIRIRVRSSLGLVENARQLRDIDATIRVPWTWWQRLSVAGAAIVGAVAAWVFYRRIDDRMRNRRTSQRMLLRQLDALDEARLKRAVSEEQAVVSAAELMRQGLMLREGRAVEYRTTEEWVQLWRQRDDVDRTDGNRNRRVLADCVESVLRTADKVKFARHAASLDEVRQSIDAARRVIGSFVDAGSERTRESDPIQADRHV